MFVKKFGAFTGLVILIVIQVTSECGCGLSSVKDIYKSAPSKCSPLVVRPVELPKFIPSKPKIICKVFGGGASLPPLKPTGDLCTCKQTVVSPAIVPKPACAACASKRMSSSQIIHNAASMLTGAVMPPAPPLLPPPAFLPSEMPINPAPIPADPVSLYLAYKMAQKACKTSEDRLAFGFRTMPKELPAVKIYKKNIPEENLYGLNGQIVELKPIPCPPKTLEEEAAEGLLLEGMKDAAAMSSAAMKQVTLGELGFGPALIKSTPVMTIGGSAAAAAAIALPPPPSPVNLPCNDGFIPGQVYMKNVVKPESYQIPLPPSPPCFDGEFVPAPLPLPAPILPPPVLLPSTPMMSYAASHSSSSCASNKQASSVMYHHLGYQ